VLIAHHVSLACFSAEDTGCKLYLTKETNDMPTCLMQYTECEYCRVAERDVRKAYLVIQIENGIYFDSMGTWSEVLVAELSLEAIEVLALALPGLGSAHRGSRQIAVEAILHDIDLSGEECTFVVATIFAGLRPYGDGHWFFGLTGATMPVTKSGEAWLACPYAGQRQLLLRETLHSDRQNAR
jgi:hypothetical protein